MKIRIRFRKYGVMKFIGHLDMMRYFQKANRRAVIDIAYSEGFSPHQIMSFAAPLGVGITSDGEYFDIQVNSTKNSKESIDALNAVMVEGVEITSYRALPDDAKKSMSLVAAADYEVSYKEPGAQPDGSEPHGYEIPGTLDELKVKVADFYDKPSEILITKKTKKSEKEMDLKQLVYDFKVIEREGKPAYYLNVCTGSTDNVKPELVLKAFYDYLGLEFNPFAFQIHRLDVYTKTEEGYLSLGEMGESIG